MLYKLRSHIETIIDAIWWRIAFDESDDESRKLLIFNGMQNVSIRYAHDNFGALCAIWQKGHANDGNAERNRDMNATRRAPQWAFEKAHADCAFAAQFPDNGHHAKAWRAEIVRLCASAASDAAYAEQAESYGWQNNQPLSDAETADLLSDYTADLIRRVGLCLFAIGGESV